MSTRTTRTGPLVGLLTGLTKPLRERFTDAAAEKYAHQLLEYLDRAWGLLTYDNLWQALGGGVVAKNSADAGTVASTASETAFTSTYEFAKNSLQAGSVFRLTMSGKYSTTGTPTLRLRVKMGSTTIWDSAAQTMGAGVTDKQWFVELIGIVRAGGASGSLSVTSAMCLFDGVIVPKIVTTSTLDLTTNLTLTSTAQWGTSSASNTTTEETFLLHKLN